MSKLLASESASILGASSNLKTRYLRARNDMEGGSFQPGQWTTLAMNATPVNASPGTQCIIEHNFPQGTPKRVESMLLRFNVVNAHATDNLRTLSPWNFISQLKVHVNNTEIHQWSTMELRILLGEYLARQPTTEAIYGSLARIRQAYDTGTLTAENFPGASTVTPVELDLAMIMPWLDNMLISAPNGRVRSLKLEFVFQPSSGTAQLDGRYFLNSTANTQLYNSTNISFSGVKLEYQLAEVTSALLLKTPVPFWPVSKFVSTYRDTDLTLAANTVTIRLAQDIARKSLIRSVYVLVEDLGAYPTAYNDSDAGGLLYSGPNSVRFTFQKTGAITTMDLTADSDAVRWFLTQHRMAHGQAPVPELYDGAGGNLVETFMPLPAIQWVTVENDSGSTAGTRDEVIGGLNTESGAMDQTLVINAAADGLFSANARLWVVLAYVDPYTVADNGGVRRLAVTGA